MKRKIITIDEAKCNGCGLCLPECPEGAIQLIDGKARLISDLFCDGLGACLGHCPQEAITIGEREAESYDEKKVMENIIKGGENVINAHLAHLREHNQTEYLTEAVRFLKEKGMEVPEEARMPAEHAAHSGGCPGSKMLDFRDERTQTCDGSGVATESELSHWPGQLQLLNPHAPYFQNADLVIAADCVPFTYADFHRRFLRGKTLIVLCPKLDRVDDLYIEKMTEIFKHNDIRSITLVHMEVPCCFGLNNLVEEALKRSGKNIIIKDYTISIRGGII
jgi:ferredoxin